VQYGPICEDLVAVTLAAAASGSGTIGYPREDRGVDLYLRRLRSLLTVPIQVKSFTHVSPDAIVSLNIPVADVRSDPNAHLALVHVPPPHDQLYRRLFLIPVPAFSKLCPRVSSQGVESFHFVADVSGLAKDTWSEYLLELGDLSDWFGRHPGWMDPVPPAPRARRATDIPLESAPSQSEPPLGRLWAAMEIERAGRGRVVTVEDRIRLDTVTLLLHDLETGQMAGLHIRTAIFNASRRIHFEIRLPNFFIDPKLYVVLVLLNPARQVTNFCLLIPSEAIPSLGYSETLTLDPLTKRFRKYQLPSEEFGSTLIAKAFGAKA
jgi:hypothetical protein